MLHIQVGEITTQHVATLVKNHVDAVKPQKETVNDHVYPIPIYTPDLLEKTPLAEVPRGSLPLRYQNYPNSVNPPSKQILHTRDRTDDIPGKWGATSREGDSERY